MMTTTEETSEALIGEVLAAEPHEIQTLYVPNGLDLFINRIREEVKKHDPDISTERGRDKIRSLARRVASSKVRLDDIGKDLVAEIKLQSGKIDAERKRMRDELDSLRDEVRKPLTDWENAEKDRLEGHEKALATLQELSSPPFGAAPDELRRRIVEVEALGSRDWEEFQKRYDIGAKGGLLSLNRILDQTVKHEEELVKIAAFQKEEAERQQADREAQMRREAAEAATRAAEAEAERRAQETAQAAAEERAGVERQRVAAEERALAAERAVEAAAARAAQEQAAAVERERQRAAEEKRRAEEAEAKREANKKHVAKINRLIIVALLEVEGAELTEDQATAIMSALAKGSIPSVKVSY